MRNARIWAITGSFLLTATAANAADVPMYPPPPQPICVPRAQAASWPGVPLCAEEFAATWYLRGDIGFTNQQVDKIHNDLRPESSNLVSSSFDTAGLFGIGAGVQVNNWLRFDVTGEYRGNSDYHGLDIIGSGNGRITDEYTAKKNEWLVLANVYADLGTWWCVTPFIGAGIGFARVTVSDFIDNCTTCTSNGNAAPGVAFGREESQWNFAWALHAGLAYQVTNNLTAEFAYRYTNLGDGVAGDVINYRGGNDFNNPTTFKNITSHDVKFGLRWTCCEDLAPVAPPPPVYQPPLMRKG